MVRLALRSSSAILGKQQQRHRHSHALHNHGSATPLVQAISSSLISFSTGGGSPAFGTSPPAAAMPTAVAAFLRPQEVTTTTTTTNSATTTENTTVTRVVKRLLTVPAAATTTAGRWRHLGFTSIPRPEKVRSEPSHTSTTTMMMGHEEKNPNHKENARGYLRWATTDEREEYCSSALSSQRRLSPLSPPEPLSDHHHHRHHHHHLPSFPLLICNFTPAHATHFAAKKKKKSLGVFRTGLEQQQEQQDGNVAITSRQSSAITVTASDATAVMQGQPPMSFRSIVTTSTPTNIVILHPGKPSTTVITALREQRAMKHEGASLFTLSAPAAAAAAATSIGAMPNERGNGRRIAGGTAAAGLPSAMAARQRMVEITEEKRLNGQRVAFTISCRPWVDPNATTARATAGTTTTTTSSSDAVFWGTPVLEQEVADATPVTTQTIPPPPPAAASHTPPPASPSSPTALSQAWLSASAVSAAMTRDAVEREVIEPAPPLRDSQHQQHELHAAQRLWPPPVHPTVLKVPEPVKRVILVRAGPSASVTDRQLIVQMPDWRIPLLEQGKILSRQTGRELAELIGDEPVYFYHSPYQRAKESLEHVLKGYKQGQLERRMWRQQQQAELDRFHSPPTPHIPTPSHTDSLLDGLDQVQGIREDSRLRDGDVGRYDSAQELDEHLQQRERYGPFFYRFPHGESGADVCDRVTSFLGTFQRERAELKPDTNVIIVTHDLVIRMFIKRWFHLNVETFHQMCSVPWGSMSTLSRVHHQSYFRLNEECVEQMGLPASLNEHNGYRFRNKDFLGSISSGAPFM